MRKKDVIDYFGNGSATATALGISRQAVDQWPEIVPENTAYRIQVLTGNKLKVDPKLYHRKARAR